jgi:hypothetical protein
MEVLSARLPATARRGERFPESEWIARAGNSTDSGADVTE